MFVERRRNRDERGAVLIAGIFGLVVLLAFGALVVDLLRMQRIGLSVQRAVDAASLAAGKGLKGDPYTVPPSIDEDGEEIPEAEEARRERLTAKRAVILALRENLIAEGLNELATGAGWELAGTQDAHDPGSLYTGTEFKVADLTVIVERGAWYYQEDVNGENDWDSSQNGPYFESLESESGVCPEDTRCTGRPEQNYLFANGVRVRIINRSHRSFFPLAWAGTAEMGGAVREAVASVQRIP